MGAAKPRKPGTQPLLIAPGTSPYHTKALKLLVMHSSDPSHIHDEPEPQSSKSSIESVRRAKYNILPLRERSPQNRGTFTKCFASMSKPDFAATFPRSPSLPCMSNQTLTPLTRAGTEFTQSVQW